MSKGPRECWGNNRNAEVGHYLTVGLLALACCLLCATFRNHGYIPPEEDLAENWWLVSTPKQASRKRRRAAHGRRGAERGWQLLSMCAANVKTLGRAVPEVVDRQVVAISFDSAGVLSNIETFGLQDGRVVALTRRVTGNDVNNASASCVS